MPFASGGYGPRVAVSGTRTQQQGVTGQTARGSLTPVTSATTVPRSRVSMLFTAQLVAPHNPADCALTLGVPRYSQHVLGGRQLTEEEITGLLIAVLFAGQHTSSITTSWTGIFMAANKVGLSGGWAGGHEGNRAAAGEGGWEGQAWGGAGGGRKGRVVCGPGGGVQSAPAVVVCFQARLTFAIDAPCHRQTCPLCVRADTSICVAAGAASLCLTPLLPPFPTTMHRAGEGVAAGGG